MRMESEVIFLKSVLSLTAKRCEELNSSLKRATYEQMLNAAVIEQNVKDCLSSAKRLMAIIEKKEKERYGDSTIQHNQ